MSVLPVFLLLCLAATGLCVPHGWRPADVGSHPYMVDITNWTNTTIYEYTRCGGTLISREWVLTAAHCLMRSQHTAVFLGSHILFSGFSQLVGGEDVIIHPGFIHNKTGAYNDIALIKLDEPAKLNYKVKIARLAEKEASFLGDKCVTAGIGSTSTDKTDPRILEVKSTVISMEVCKTLLDCAEEDQAEVTEKQICVHDATIPQGFRMCFGDIGGQLMCGAEQNVLAGILSLGDDCSFDYPSKFTRVSAYRDWIYQHAGV